MLNEKVSIKCNAQLIYDYTKIQGVFSKMVQRVFVAVLHQN